MISQNRETIRAKKVNAEAGLEVTDVYHYLEGMEDNPYMKERAADLATWQNVYWQIFLVKLPNPASSRSDRDCAWLDLQIQPLGQKLCKSFCNQHWWTYKPLSYQRNAWNCSSISTDNITEIVPDGDILAALTVIQVKWLSTQLMSAAEFKVARSLCEAKSWMGDFKMLKQWLLMVNTLMAVNIGTQRRGRCQCQRCRSC